MFIKRLRKIKKEKKYTCKNIGKHKKGKEMFIKRLEKIKIEKDKLVKRFET